MNGVIVEIIIDPGEIEAEIRQDVEQVEAALNEAIDDLLDLAESTQIKAYTASALPAQPPGSAYQRTFQLASASKKRRTDRSLPTIGGEWYADESVADYAEFVLGRQADQAAIHRGRWKSLEEIEAELQSAAPGIVAKKLKDRKL